MAMQLGNGGGGVAPQVNVTPLVDVALVVLIIFMMVTPLLTRQVHLHLPTDDAATPPPPPDQREEPIVISIDARGAMRLGRDLVSAEELQHRLPRAIAASRSKIVHFDADDAVPYADAVAVVDRARGAGATKIAIVTKPLAR
jgi:biopolymer transport protein TolR